MMGRSFIITFMLILAITTASACTQGYQDYFYISKVTMTENSSIILATISHYRTHYTRYEIDINTGKIGQENDRLGISSEVLFGKDTSNNFTRYSNWDPTTSTTQYILYQNTTNGSDLIFNKTLTVHILNTAETAHFSFYSKKTGSIYLIVPDFINTTSQKENNPKILIFNSTSEELIHSQEFLTYEVYNLIHSNETIRIFDYNNLLNLNTGVYSTCGEEMWFYYNQSGFTNVGFPLDPRINTTYSIINSPEKSSILLKNYVDGIQKVIELAEKELKSLIRGNTTRNLLIGVGSVILVFWIVEVSRKRKKKISKRINN